MRERTALLVAAVGLGVALAATAWLARAAGGTGAALAPIDVVGRLTARMAGGLGACVARAAGEAHAQDVLEFRPVPAESADAEDEPARRRRPPSPPASAPRAPAPPSRPGPEPLAARRSGDIMRIGSDVRIAENEVVAGDLLVVGGDITVDGRVEGDVVALGGDVRLGPAARVDGDVACVGGELREEPGATVGGQRVTTKGVRGLWDGRDRDARDVWRGLRVAGRVFSSLLWLLVVAAIAWGFAGLAPARTGAALATLRREAGTSLGIGLMVWALLIPSIIALSVILVILCITVIGIPLAVAVAIAYALLLGGLVLWGFVIGGAAVGEWVERRRRRGPGATEPAGAGAPAVAGERPAGEYSLVRKAVIGVLVLAGSKSAGEVLETLSFAPPLPALGVFVGVVASLAGALAVTFGMGGLLRHEFSVGGGLRRWWSGRRPSPAAGGGSGGATVAGTAPAPPPS